MSKLLNFIKLDEGATTVEYSLMVLLIAIGCVGLVVVLGQNVLALFNSMPPFGAH